MGILKRITGAIWLRNFAMANIRDHFKNWDAVLAELVARPRPDAGAVAPSGAILLGKGQCSDVWGAWKDYALKLFRHRRGIPVANYYMTGEIATYEKLGSVRNSGLPRLYEHANIEGKEVDAAPCGWALYSRVPGKPLTYDDLKGLDADTRKRWVHDVVKETVNIERCLNNVSDPLPAWENNYMGVRVPLLEARYQQGKISTKDRDLAIRLRDRIEYETSGNIKYLHGDFNPPNVIADLTGVDREGSIVKFVDPLISHEAPEANWRHFTLMPNLADGLATEYDRQTGTTTNEHLMYAIGAATHLYMSIADPAQAAIRRPAALDKCLLRAGLK
jgi:hypothetical protein